MSKMLVLFLSCVELFLLFDYMCFVVYLMNFVFGKVYKIMFDWLGFIYMQYFILIVLVEYDVLMVGSFGDKLFLELNMLIFIFKKFEVMGYVECQWDMQDECVVCVCVIKIGCKLCDCVVEMNVFVVVMIGFLFEDFVWVQKGIVVLCDMFIQLVDEDCQVQC